MKFKSGNEKIHTIGWFTPACWSRVKRFPKHHMPNVKLLEFDMPDINEEGKAGNP